MKQQGRSNNIAPKVNKILLILNVILFFCALVIALYINMREHTITISMLIVMLVAILNICGCWLRLKRKKV